MIENLKQKIFNNSKWNFKIFLILGIYCLIYPIKSNFQSKLKSGISDINVLLPVCEANNCNRVSYEIEAFGGCYEWKLDQPDFLDIEKIKNSDEVSEGENECFTKVRIYPKNIFQNPSDKVVFLSARNKNSNEVFKCRIGFGKIKKLKIIKRFDVINVGEIVEIDVKVINFFCFFTLFFFDFIFI